MHSLRRNVKQILNTAVIRRSAQTLIYLLFTFQYFMWVTQLTKERFTTTTCKIFSQDVASVILIHTE